MYAKESQVDEIKMPKWAAAQDAQERNRKNRELWSTAAQQQLAELYELVSRTYASRVFTNYRESMMVAKVESPRISDYAALGRLDAFVAANGIERVKTKTALLFRIKA